jgi:hypothetical protein
LQFLKTNGQKMTIKWENFPNDQNWKIKNGI